MCYTRADENAELIECPSCTGSGGFDVSRNEEDYTQWEVCTNCDGEGLINE